MLLRSTTKEAMQGNANNADQLQMVTARLHRYAMRQCHATKLIQKNMGCDKRDTYLMSCSVCKR
jgi:hypothetical protein